jgi:ubiquinone/menaquinone biosynthesis C-methylase UbiE
VISQSWDGLPFLNDSLPRAWREHGRSAHLDLIRRWQPTCEGRWLKTDLAEELVEERALVPHLEGHWVGVDVSRAVAARSGRGCRSVVVSDVRDLAFQRDTFDGVLSTSTLDHFTSAGQISDSLRELHRVTKRGGRLILTLDNRSNPMLKLRNALPRRMQRMSRLVPYFVGVTLSDRDGCAALRRSGFDVIDVAYLLHAPHVVGTRLARFDWYRRWLPKLDRLGATRFGRYTGHFVAFHAVAR